MGKFNGAKMVGLRNKETGELIAVYPYSIKDSDEETEKAVKDWYYTTSCEAEEELRNAYVDLVTEEELKSVNNQNQLNG